MSMRAANFVEQWIQKNVKAQPHVAENGADLRPNELAEQCAADAAKEGISREQIVEAFGRLFEDRMAEAIDHAADVEVDRLAAEDD